MDNAAKRDIKIDNAKGALILLVVLGHLLQPTLLREDPSLWFLSKPLYLLVYLFHMPLFVFLSGYFSKLTYTGSRLKENCLRFLLPYLFFQFLNQNIGHWVAWEANTLFIFNPFFPAHMMWYLLSLFMWRQMLPFFVRLKFPLVISSVLALASGYLPLDGNFLSASQMISFFPFFILGYQLRNTKNLHAVINRIPLSLAILAFFMAAAFSIQVKPRFAFWLWHAYSYSYMGHPERYAFIYKLLTMSFSTVVCFAFLKLMPKQKTFLSFFGKNTLYTYLLHSLLLQYLLSIDFFRFINNIYGFFFLFVLSASISLFCSLPFVRFLTAPLVEPLKWTRVIKSYLTGYVAALKGSYFDTFTMPDQTVPDIKPQKDTTANGADMYFSSPDGIQLTPYGNHYPVQ